MKRLTEQAALTKLRHAKAAYQSKVKREYEHRALSCRECKTPGVCCTDQHFVNVHITRLEAVHIRETIARTPRLDERARRALYIRAHETVARYRLHTSGDTFRQTFACPLFVQGTGCTVHQRAKPAPCIQHACYDDWADMPPIDLQWRTENLVEKLNTRVYGQAWAWLPVPVWLTLVDPDADAAELRALERAWEAQRVKHQSNFSYRLTNPTLKSNQVAKQKASASLRQLPVLR